MLRPRVIWIALALALLAGCRQYRSETGGYDLSRFREDPGLISLPDGLKGLVPTNAEAIRTIEARDRGGDLRFIVVGDTVSGHNETFKAFLREIGTLDPKPAFIVHLGDRTVSPVIESFGAYLKDIQDPPCPIVHVDGNHDVREEGERMARAFFGDGDFTFDLDGRRFVFMDDAGPRWTHGFRREQLDWLEGVLAAPGPKRAFFFAHVPPRAPFTRIDPGFASFLTPAIENEQAFLDILVRHHVVMAAFGHRHVHASLVYKGVLMVITGGGGSRNFLDPDVKEPLFTKKKHYTLVDIPASRQDQPLQGILSCMGQGRETIFISSFIQPALVAGLVSPGVSLGAYPASNLGPFRPGDPLPIVAGSSRKP
jgi:Calcineurin-like phosphoesterase